MSSSYKEETSLSLEELALGFVLRMQGYWTEESLDPMIEYLNKKKIPFHRDQLVEKLGQAKRFFNKDPNHLFVCKGRPCLKRQFEGFPKAVLQEFGPDKACPVTFTQCQGPCKQAPFATLRIGTETRQFSQFSNPSDWTLISKQIQNAVVQNTLVIDWGSASPFVFNFTDPTASQDVHLKSLQFLVGHFKGQGRFIDFDKTFDKEIIGAWELGGFLSIRMTATYPMQNGRQDTHRVMVILGKDPAEAHISARAYTDHGMTIDFTIQQNGSELEFEDTPPGRFGKKARARKRIYPVNDGLKEVLEIDRGDGEFKPYYEVIFAKTKL